MRRSRCSSLGLITAAVLLLCTSSIYAQTREENEKRVQELLSLQKKSPNGVITLDINAFNTYSAGKSRPYSLFIFGDSRKLRKTSKLNLDTRYESFSTVAKAFASSHAGKPTEGKVFFVRIVFEDSKDVFARLGIKGLPYVARIPPSLHVKPSSSISVDSTETMEGGSSSTGLHPKDYGSFIQERTGLSPGDLSAAGAASRSRFLPLLTLAFLAGVIAIGYRLYYAPFMRIPALYAAGGIVIFWFAISGGMYNIIRGVPFIGYSSRTRQAVLFMSGSGQVGAEGFIMGSFAMIFSLLVAAATKLLPAVKDDSERRLRGWVILGAMVVILRIILGNHAWKTGLHTYWYF